jgi:hypothetical protein
MTVFDDTLSWMTTLSKPSKKSKKRTWQQLYSIVIVGFITHRLFFYHQRQDLEKVITYFIKKIKPNFIWHFSIEFSFKIVEFFLFL